MHGTRYIAYEPIMDAFYFWVCNLYKMGHVRPAFSKFLMYFSSHLIALKNMKRDARKWSRLSLILLVSLIKSSIHPSDHVF